MKKDKYIPSNIGRGDLTQVEIFDTWEELEQFDGEPEFIIVEGKLYDKGDKNGV